MTETAFGIFFIFLNPISRLNFLIGSKKPVFPFMSESFTNDNYISPPILSTLIKILATFSSNAFPVSLYTSNI